MELTINMQSSGLGGGDVEAAGLEELGVPVGYEFEWDRNKAESNFRKHGVQFDEAMTAFGDPLALVKTDPDHSFSEQRYLLLANSNRRKLLVSPSRSGLRGLARSQRGWRIDGNGEGMKKKASRRGSNADRDTMRPEYDFSRAVRGVTAARYAQGTNVVVIDPEVLDVFPDGEAVNETLRALAPVICKRRKAPRRRRSA